MVRLKTADTLRSLTEISSIRHFRNMFAYVLSQTRHILIIRRAVKFLARAMLAFALALAKKDGPPLLPEVLRW